MKRQYVSYQDAIDFLTQAMADHPDLIRLESIGNTCEGRPIMMVTLSENIANADTKPALLYTGTIHAREWIGIELAINFVRYIIDNYPNNPKVLQALKRNTLYMVPCLNPDGFEYSRLHYSFWRKNRRDNGDGTFGVDLNRNFDVNFRKTNNTSSNIYGGTHAFSEPETQAIKNFVDNKPNITIALDYHSQGNVFFPAHKFNHEAELEGTDLNVLCANMAQEIYRISGRRYGIHRGKPPANLINGSGREYYFNRNILSSVVEVGTRNIPDYLTNMVQDVEENIPALLYALGETINYSVNAPARPQQFTTTDINSHQCDLIWADSKDEPNCYFEIYRSEKPKDYCTEHNLIAITANKTYVDKQLKANQRYFYNIRKVNRDSNIKSPFAPELKLKTKLNRDEFSNTLFPQSNNIGYVSSLNQTKNKEHFGHNSLFIGVNKTQGVCYGVIDFDLLRLPPDAIIRKATFYLYPMNRVGTKIEDYGEWSISILNPEDITDITNFAEIDQATPVETLGYAIGSDQQTQGIWRHWYFNDVERQALQSQLTNGRLLLRIQGPKTLPLANDSQMMQFDIGYGRFGGGIHYRPNIEIEYTLAAENTTISAGRTCTSSKDGVEYDCLRSGFDSNGDTIFGQVNFDLSALTDNGESDIVITQAYVELCAEVHQAMREPMRFIVEVSESDSEVYDDIKKRQRIAYLGYDVSSEELKVNPKHLFMFDSAAKQQLEQLHTDKADLTLTIKATSASRKPNATVDWSANKYPPKLVVEYIKRRKQALPAPTQFNAKLEKGIVRLEWEKPDDADLMGCFVVRNCFHPPRSPFDGVKLYAGKDNYTYDRFGNPNIAKYYSVFSYDSVPNYSQAISLSYSSDEIIPIQLDDFEAQDELEQKYHDGELN
ncbi:peptidase [Moritella sp. 24]|uniref:M14 family zinc carboxypeptidase n=1 Tax=Moritella sp. 24 TaxID=2746230 RepID=UPI001BA98ECB|nr:M14 family zinc carboxypeptidase [Moritella sp. 24]QUM77725.1 peptidase [Moritella sp. 24]